jgi:hypothetical protein
LKNIQKIYYWASDLRKNSGEGILANLFISDIKKKFKNFTLTNINKSNQNYNSLYNRYFINLLGALKLWKYYLEGHRTAYINYLPIWNFLIFLIIPPKTIIGPITGSIIYNKKSLLNVFLRGLLIKIFIKISLLLIFLRLKKILFSTELLKKIIKKKRLNNVYFNYVTKAFQSFLKRKIKKNIDFLIYYRTHINKDNSFIDYFIKNISEKKFKIFVIGDKIISNKVKNCGYKSRDAVKQLLLKTKFTFGSTENLYTLFVLDAISKDVTIFYDKNLRSFNREINYNKIVPINFENKKETLKYILKYILKTKINKKKNFFKRKNYNEYFRQFMKIN